MKLFRWNSPALADWSDGDIVTFGTDVNDARERAQTAIAAGIFGSLREKLFRDVELMPEIIELDVIFITGGA